MKAVFKKFVVRILTLEAALLLRRTNPTIIAITGSVGKTSTKDAIYAVLKDHYHTRKSQKSFNSELGVPLTVLGLQNAWSNPILWLWNLVEGLFTVLFPGQYPKVLVLECGVDRPGDMEALTSWIKPHVVVLTRLPNVPVHVEYFSQPEEVVVEKMRLVHALRSDGVLIYNHDDQIIQNCLDQVRQHAIGYSRYLPSQFRISDDQIVYHDQRPVGMSFTLTHIDESINVRVPGVIGVQQAYAFAAAAAVANKFDVPLSTVAGAAAAHTPPPGRMRALLGIKGTVIVDDTYNSSPVSVEGALTTMRELVGPKRRILVLGDMLELGRFSVREHERAGEQAATTADLLITVGIRARKIAESALEHGLDEANILQFETAEQAGRELQNLIAPGDFILVKASQGVRTEKIVEEIMAEPERAGELLVRQDSAWQHR